MGIRTIMIIFFLLLFSRNYSQNVSCAKVIATVKVNDSYSIRFSEVSVQHYFNFIFCNDFDPKLFPDSGILNSLPYKFLLDDFRKKDNSKYFQILKRDSAYTGFFFKLKKQENKKENRRLKTILSMPITGISYEQALLYCKWLENKWNFYMRRFPICHLEIVLPSIDLYKNLSIEKNGIVKLNTDVAEMTSTKNLSFKGSYNENDKDSNASQIVKYNKPETWLGFRFIVLTNH